ncbi:CaiB/BaiF CoA transferase family protein [Nocardioides caeni]|uniref:CoA transferase n=1 Tax=Nocardioides caeni TaxID=574700 RepID=A0A4S8MZU1_9ACTN|nr:CoA transferase [Nocardioides caeni]THV09017.1 CoA transferase [Nocardioides caeni]
MTGPLHGIRVLELGSFIAGPFAGQLLADYGAEVLKIEPPGKGDAMRTWGQTLDGESLWWPTIARGKRSVALDLHGEEGRSVLRRLADEVDVILENFRPGLLERWGLDHATLAQTNPGLVMVHVSGYGQTGPRSRDAGFGSIGEAMGGIRHTTGDPDRPPARAGVSLGDSLAALFAVIGTLAAINERHRSGHGQEVDVAIYEAVAALMESTLADHELAGVTRGRSGSVLPGVAPSNVYPTRDGSGVIVAANADAVFGRLMKAMGRAELASDERFADHQGRGANATELDALIGAWTAERDAKDLLAELADAGVPAGQIYSAAEMLDDEHYRAREMILRLTNAAGHAVPSAGVVPKFSRSRPDVPTPGPPLGADTRAVLADAIAGAGLDYDALVAAGVIAEGAIA